MAKVRIERKTDWSLGAAAPYDKEKLVSFFSKTTWREKPARDIYEWKFEKNPQGETFLIAGVNSEAAVIAANAFMPWNLSFNNNSIGASQWVDMIIELAYRGQNMPSKMLEMGLVKFRQSGSRINFAFPNETGVLVHKENNGFYLGGIVRYAKPLKTQYLVDRFVKSPVLSRFVSAVTDIVLQLFSKEAFSANLGRLTFTAIDKDELNPVFDVFWNKAAKLYPMMIMTRRDRAYLYWKFVDTPNGNRRLYALKKGDEIYGYAVLETAGNTGYIVDILAYDDKSLKNIIVNALKLFRKEKLDSAVFVALEKNMYAGAFKSFGFVERPDKKQFYIYVDEGIDNREYFLNPANWYITIGDCDIERM